MISRRVYRLSTKRILDFQPCMLSTTLKVSPAAIGMQQIRTATTSKSPKPSEGASREILAAQRRLRPVSPHLSIYRPQITWYGSITHRITGITLSGGLYLFSLAYLAGPVFGLHLDSAAIVETFSSWPYLAKASVKTVVALPFVYHGLNGLRHLVWDNAAMMTNRQVNMTGWAAVGLTLVSAIYLGFK